MHDPWTVMKDARGAAFYEDWRAWQAIDQTLNRIAGKLDARITAVEGGARHLLALMLRGARERAEKAWWLRRSFFRSRTATAIRQKHAAPQLPSIRRKSSCGCHNSAGVRVRKASACSRCRNGTAIICHRSECSSIISCDTPEGRLAFRSEKAFRSWAAERNIRVEG